MRNKIMIILALFAVIVTMPGIASANPPDYTCKTGNVNDMGYAECLKSTFDGTYFQTSVLNIDASKYYVLRYYSPAALQPLCDPSIFNSCQNYFETLEKDYVPLNYVPGDVHVGVTSYDEQSPFKPSPGWWVITLWHSGQGTESIITSYKVLIPIEVPIPEFSTVAIPIAGVLGLVFFFQQRKKKEE